MHLVEFILEYYPEWYGIQEYTSGKTVAFCKVSEQWGLLGNFAPTPMTVDGVPFDCAEKMFQVMKFEDPESRRMIYAQKGLTIKMKAKRQERVGAIREDWGRIFIDAMKFCLMQKYTQCVTFRSELGRTNGFYIVEKQANPLRPADAYSARLSEDGKLWAGPNIMGRLLMELRDNGVLTYSLPEDVMHFSDLV